MDDIIVFHNLTREDLARIVEIQTDRLRRMLEDRGMKLVLTDAAKQVIVNHGYDPAFGARPIKRTLQRMVADPLALAILEGKFTEGDTIQVDVDGSGLDRLRFVKKEAARSEVLIAV